MSLGDIDQVGYLTCDGCVGRAAKGIGFGVAEHVGETEEIASLDDEVADACFELQSCTTGDTIPS